MHEQCTHGKSYWVLHSTMGSTAAIHGHPPMGGVRRVMGYITVYPSSCMKTGDTNHSSASTRTLHHSSGCYHQPCRGERERRASVSPPSFQSGPLRSHHVGHEVPCSCLGRERDFPSLLSFGGMPRHPIALQGFTLAMLSTQPVVGWPEPTVCLQSQRCNCVRKIYCDGPTALA